MQQSENFLQELPGCILRHSQKLLLPLAQNSTPRAPELGQWGELTLHPLPGQAARSCCLSEPSVTGPAGISLKVSSGTSCSFQGWICCLWRSMFHQGSPLPCYTAGTRVCWCGCVLTVLVWPPRGPPLGFSWQQETDTSPSWWGPPLLLPGEAPSRRVWLGAGFTPKGPHPSMYVKFP